MVDVFCFLRISAVTFIQIDRPVDRDYRSTAANGPPLVNGKHWSLTQFYFQLFTKDLLAQKVYLKCFNTAVLALYLKASDLRVPGRKKNRLMHKTMAPVRVSWSDTT